jgi:uncharacterized protein with von Willebrand factor type A (vWA) domain
VEVIIFAFNFFFNLSYAKTYFVVDNTLGAASHSMKEIVKEEADDYFVVIMSDANIAQYNIHPNDIARSKSLFISCKNTSLILFQC